MSDDPTKLLNENANEALEDEKVTNNSCYFLNLNSTDLHNPLLVDLKGQKVKNKSVSINFDVTHVTDVTTNNDGACSGNMKENINVTHVTDLLENAIDPNETPPPKIEKVELKRPCYGVYDDFNEFGKAGVYYHSIKTTKVDIKEINDYICDPLHITAGSCDSSDNNYGLMLNFKNQSGRWVVWLMPLEMLSGGCDELRAELLKRGLRIDHHKRNMLPSYLQSQRPQKRLECALKVGWHGDVFVLPDRVIGDRDDVFFQSDHAVTAEYCQRGTLKQWQDNVSKYCTGNPLLIFQVSTSFAGALLKKCHIDYAGFHVFGPSSCGKSTGHKGAGSVFGGEGFRKSWKATGNGLEAVAVIHNDGLLALDELGDSDAREVNQIIYMLGNGTGKQRANVKGTARQAHKWRIVLLSNGEKTLKSHFQEKGLAVKAGQELRLLEILVFGQYGSFDELHGMKDGRLFSDTLQKNTADYYGSAGIAYLEKLVNDTQDLGELLNRSIQNFITDDMEPQEKRAARAFALVALAGELSTSYGITRWKEGDALKSALTCFQQWRNHRGVGSTEDRVILEAVRDFINRYGDSKFISITSSGITNDGINNSTAKAGWYEDEYEKDRVYHFTGTGLRDATTGHDFKMVRDILVKSGWLLGTESKGKKISGKNERVYSVTPKEGGEL